MVFGRDQYNEASIYREGKGLCQKHLKKLMQMKRGN